MEDEKPQLAAEPVASNAGSDENTHTANNGIIKRIHLPEDENVEREKILELWHEQNRYIDHIEAKLKVSEEKWGPGRNIGHPGCFTIRLIITLGSLITGCKSTRC